MEGPRGHAHKYKRSMHAHCTAAFTEGGGGGGSTQVRSCRTLTLRWSHRPSEEGRGAHWRGDRAGAALSLPPCARGRTTWEAAAPPPHLCSGMAGGGPSRRCTTSSMRPNACACSGDMKLSRSRALATVSSS